MSGSVVELGLRARRPRARESAPVRRTGKAGASPCPSSIQLAWLRRGLDQPGGKLPLFDGDGKKIDPRTIRRCLDAGWAEPWFANPVKPDWLVCRLTESGRALASANQAGS